MEIIINRCENKREVVDEAYGIMRIYKKLLKNPGAKIRKRSTVLQSKCAFTLVYSVLVVCFAILYAKPVFFFCLGVALLALVIDFRRISVWFRYLNERTETGTDAILRMDEEKLELVNNIQNRTFVVEWKELRQVLIAKYCIVFLPEIKEAKNILTIPVDYEQQVIEAIEKYHSGLPVAYNR